MIRHIFKTLLFVVACGAFGTLSATIAEKHYIMPQEIELTESTIIAHRDGVAFELEGLHTDQGGVFFVEGMQRCLYCHRPLNPKNTCETPFCQQ